MEIQAKYPSECTKDELREFEALVIEGGEVSPIGLSDRIKQANTLISVRDNSACIAVGALKRPIENYKNNVFKKAGVFHLVQQYPFELGWVFSSPSALGKGVGRIIMDTIVNLVGNKGCFATTRLNNEVMHHLFDQYSFFRVGNEYPSKNGDYSLILYTYKP